MLFYEHFAKEESCDHHDHAHEFVKAKKSSSEPEVSKAQKSSSRPEVSCEFCSSHWGTTVRIFGSLEDFEKSPLFGGDDKVINDPEGVTIAVWPGKNNVGRAQADWWLCASVHPFCGCEFDNHRFKSQTSEELEDWYSKLEWD
ncbi:hypothetical protein [Leptospira sp. GIMC2001]|uniref:hypothetical protein n=1 Tax=Leptospira sp. GIMC2001 TaxID=1513297 RepID=UPI00234A235D|nr:hypothetical protein [Leptospira sp. GIMC2001]WCL51527.1 hypothetical protein O4O04_20130 [Leptospira sp. GIMC2001]